MGLVRMEEHRVRPVRMSPSWPSAPRYAPYDKGRFQFTLGIRELDPAEWIEIDDQYAPQLAEKRRLLAERPGEVRSEEHTSELQSLMRISYAVFCLKKTKRHQHHSE